MSLVEITEELKNEVISPGRLSELHLKLAGEYAFISARLTEILKIEDEEWLKIRAIPGTTDKAADKTWGATEPGMSLKVYKQELKMIEKLFASIRLRISVMSEEAHNQY